MEAQPMRAHETSRTRWVRAVGVLVFAATAFLPVRGCEPGPARFAPGASGPAAADFEGGEVPAERLPQALAAGWARGGAVSAVWEARTWYPYLLAPIWMLALAAAASGSVAARRIAAAGLVCVSVGVALFELPYVLTAYEGVVSGSGRAFEVAAVWVLICVVLFVRPAGRRLGEIEACVSAQALLALLHGLTFPAGDARRWLVAGHGPGAVTAAVFTCYRPAFWLALGALAFAALPGYAPPRLLRQRIR